MRKLVQGTTREGAGSKSDENLLYALPTVMGAVREALPRLRSAKQLVEIKQCGTYLATVGAVSRRQEMFDLSGLVARLHHRFGREAVFTWFLQKVYPTGTATSALFAVQAQGFQPGDFGERLPYGTVSEGAEKV